MRIGLESLSPSANPPVIDDAVRSRIVIFFKENKSPKIDQVAQLATDLNIPVDIVTEQIYEYLSAFSAGGRFNEKGLSIDDFDKEELAKGLDIEKEHVDESNPYAKFIQSRITSDHMAEFKTYNSALLDMEKSLEDKKSSSDGETEKE